jgi:ankyrin repeat protein
MKPIPTFTETCRAIVSGTFCKWPKEVQKAALAAPENPHAHQRHTPLHESCIQGFIDKIPKDTLEEDLLLAPDEDGWTPIGYAALHGHLDKIPKEFLSEKTLLPPSTLSNPNPRRPSLSPLHLAARGGSLHQIPPELLTEENLLTPDEQGEVPLLVAAHQGLLDTLPCKLSRPLLLQLLESPKTSEKSRQWITQEIRRRHQKELTQTLRNCLHPEL